MREQEAQPYNGGHSKNVPLTTGSKLGPYEILSPLGAGGMGEVYRARDTRLGRDVAIKVLAAHLSSNPDLKLRFEREARAISSLQHPHICTLFDVGHEGETDYLVMEFLEGETLADRIHKGPLPLAELLKVGAEITSALEKAHRQGVIHRDLKPGNVMLTKAGAKLMDFGLAKAAAAGKASGAAPTFSATMSEGVSPITASGTIVGTVQYMAPEQIEGKEIDARTDIFAMGAVLYEMATGKRAFHGKSQISIASAILEKDPEPISTVKPMSPPALDFVVRTCLAKNPDARFQTAHDVELQLKWIAEGGSQAGVAAAMPARRKLNQRVAWIAAAVAALVAVAFAAAYFTKSATGNQALQASLVPPKNCNFVPTEIEISPDGTKLAFIASSKKEATSLWVRPLNSLTAQPLAGTDGASYPFWSPDSKTIGFFAEGKLKKIDAAGGPVISLADAADGRGGTWNRNGAILFSPNSAGTGLYTVAASGGAATEVQHADKIRGEEEFRWPIFMPDGRHFVFYVLSVQSANGSNQKDPVEGIYFAELGSKDKTRVLNADTDARYAAGYLFYLTQRNLVAQAFDPGKGKFNGEAFPVAQEVQYDTNRYDAAFSVSANGTLEYLQGDTGPSKLVWYDREGRQGAEVAVEGFPLYVALSPDGTRVATSVSPPSSADHDVWVYDLRRGIGTRVTADPGDHTGMIWSRNGQRLFYTKLGSEQNIYSRASSGLGPEEKVVEGNTLKFANDWSPDGKTLLYMNFAGPNGIPQVWVHSTDDSKKGHELLGTQFVSGNAAFSPDGRWVAYQSDESGKSEIYAIAYPSLATKVQISSGGGVQPRWRKDGKEIFYVSLDGKITAAPVAEKSNSLDVGATKALFDSRISQILQSLHEYDVSADGKKFLINTRAETAPEPATIYANWQADFKK